MGILDILSIIPSAFKTVDNITNAISNERIAKINAGTDGERIAADERIKALEQRRAVLIAEAGVSRANIIVRSIFAVPIIVVLWKLLVWDKVIGSLVGCSSAARGTCGIFTTDPFDDNQWKIIMIVIGFYFLYEGAVGVTRLAKR